MFAASHSTIEEQRLREVAVDKKAVAVDKKAVELQAKEEMMLRVHGHSIA